MDLGSDADFRQVFLQLIAVWRANHVEMIDRSGPSGFAWNRYARRHRCKQLVVAGRFPVGAGAILILSGCRVARYS